MVSLSFNINYVLRFLLMPSFSADCRGALAYIGNTSPELLHAPPMLLVNIGDSNPLLSCAVLAERSKRATMPSAPVDPVVRFANKVYYLFAVSYYKGVMPQGEDGHYVMRARSLKDQSIGYLHDGMDRRGVADCVSYHDTFFSYMPVLSGVTHIAEIAYYVEDISFTYRINSEAPAASSARSASSGARQPPLLISSEALCPYCSQDTTFGPPTLQCVSCMLVFHSSCVGPKDLRTPFKCDVCFQPSRVEYESCQLCHDGFRTKNVEAGVLGSELLDQSGARPFLRAQLRSDDTAYKYSYAHSCCALWTKGVTVEMAERGIQCPDPKGQYDRLKKVPRKGSAKYFATCCLCKNVKGVTVPCSELNCHLHFHISCVLQSTQACTRPALVISKVGDAFQYMVFCELHLDLVPKLTTGELDDIGVLPIVSCIPPIQDVYQDIAARDAALKTNEERASTVKGRTRLSKAAQKVFDFQAIDSDDSNNEDSDDSDDVPISDLIAKPEREAKDEYVMHLIMNQYLNSPSAKQNKKWMNEHPNPVLTLGDGTGKLKSKLPLHAFPWNLQPIIPPRMYHPNYILLLNVLDIIV